MPGRDGPGAASELIGRGATAGSGLIFAGDQGFRGGAEEGLDGAGFGDFATECGAHVFRAGNDADAPEVEAIGVPACSHRGIIGVIAIGVPCAGEAERLEWIVGKFEEFSAQRFCVFGATRAVARIPPIIHALAVVK